MLTTLENRFCVLFPNAKLQTSPCLTMDLKVRCSGLFYIVLNCSALFCFVLIRFRQNTKKSTRTFDSDAHRFFIPKKTICYCSIF